MKTRSLNHYTYLITDTLNQMYYIGVRSSKALAEDDTSYMGSCPTLNEAIGNFGAENFEKVIIRSDFETRLEADIHENKLHLEYDAATNPQFYNLKNGRIGFHATAETNQKRIDKINSQAWLDTVGKEQRRKQRETVRINNVGRTRGLKNKEIFNNTEWKETTGIEKSAKISELKRIRDKQNKKECVHCSRFLDPANYAKSHGDKCKLNKVTI